METISKALVLGLMFFGLHYTLTELFYTDKDDIIDLKESEVKEIE